LQLGSCCVGLLHAFYIDSHPFSWARSEIHQLALCYQHVMLVCRWFFNFAMSFGFGCSSLVQETRFVDHYLLYFRQWLLPYLLSAHLPFQALFTESSHGQQLLALPPFSGAVACQPSTFPSFV
jgi:hypothetical protein